MADKIWLPAIFSSGMVLQQQMPVHLHGQVKPNQAVTVSLSRHPLDGRPVSPRDPEYGEVFSRQVLADPKGRFSCRIPAQAGSLDPCTLTLTAGKNERACEDILFGEVWMAAGQSNMAMPIRATRAADQVESLANVPHVRILVQSENGLDSRHPDYQPRPLADLCAARWIRGDQPDAVGMVSAVAFSFARSLHVDLKIPVGIIETARGGSMIQSWLSRETVDAKENLRRHIEAGGFYRTEKNWNLHSDPEWNEKQPGALYNHKIAPLEGLALRGLLWYQGESDYAYPDYYREALISLLEDWQKLFRPADSRGLHLLYVQLAAWYYGHRDHTRLARFNEMLAAVRRQLPSPAALLPIYDLPLTYDAAPVDWRHPIHPDDKLPIGERLKTLALGLSYGRRQPPAAPECIDIERIDNKLMLSFKPIGDGLRLTGEGSRLRGFTICGPDRVFLEAEAKLLYGVRVLVWHEQIDQPETVAYAFTDMNQDANLVSRDHIPVMPFRSDQQDACHLPPSEWRHCETLRIWALPKMEQMMKTGWQPAWQARRGQMQLKIEPANKTEGDAAFLVSYQTGDDKILAFGPVLDYDSMFPPADWHYFDRLALDVFNADQQMKAMQVALYPAGGQEMLLPERKVIISALRWQTLTFRLDGLDRDQLAAIARLDFLLEDRKQKGQLYLDRIRLLLPEKQS